MTSACVFGFVDTLLRRNSEVKKTSDSELNSFANFSRISDEDIMKDQEDVEKSLTHKLMSRIDIT